MTRAIRPFLLALLPLALASCDTGERNSPAASPAVDTTSSESSKDFGDYVLHFNALTTDGLSPDVARAYNIVRSKNRAMLNVTILQKRDDGTPTPVAGSVSAYASNLTGQLKNMNIRQIVEGEAIYYIGEVSISDGETLIFDVSATPINETSRFNVKFRRQFYVD